ncbi:MAG: type IV secretion system protein [Sphingomicrobium sp.]
MIATFCNTSDADRFATRLLADTDCQTMSMVEHGYAALSQPGGSVSIALTGLMTISVAFLGYRLLLGRGMLLADAIGLTIKLGVVLLIASSWQSWEAIAYSGLARAPTQIAGDLLASIGASDPIHSLEQMLDQLAQAAVGYRMRAGIASPLVGGPPAAAAVLNMSAVFLTISIVGVLVAARVVLAVLLAIAPAMAGLILFDGTRRMAEGWLAAIAGAAIAPLFVLVLAAIEFALMTPMLARLLNEQATGVFENTSVMPIGLVTIVFGIATIFALRAAAQIAKGVRLPRFLGQAIIAGQNASESNRMPDQRMTPNSVSTTESVTRALDSMTRRESIPRDSSFVASKALTRSRQERAAVASPFTSSGSEFGIRPEAARTRPRRVQRTTGLSRAARRRDA